METFGALLKKVRLERGLTVSQLAEEVSATPSYLRMIEQNKRTPSQRLALNLIDILKDDAVEERDGVLIWHGQSFYLSRRTPPGRSVHILSWH